MAKFALIGGKEADTAYDFSLEEKLIKASNLKDIKILYIPFAQIQDLKSGILKFQKLMMSTNYQYQVLESLEATEITTKFAWSTIIYIGGGHAEELINYVGQSKDFMNALNKAIKDDKLIMGISAGAIMLSKYGMGDANAYSDIYDGYNYQMVKGLGITNITICPHYDHKGLWCYNDAVKKYDYDGYALEDNTAIYLEEDKVKVFKTKKDKSVYLFKKEFNYLMSPLYEDEK